MIVTVAFHFEAESTDVRSRSPTCMVVTGKGVGVNVAVGKGVDVKVGRGVAVFMGPGMGGVSGDV
jgi:hypothetical protein